MPWTYATYVSGVKATLDLSCSDAEKQFLKESSCLSRSLTACQNKVQLSLKDYEEIQQAII